MSSNALAALSYKRKDILRLNPLRQAAIVYWAISSSVKHPKSALVCGNKQSMATKFAEQSGFDTITFLPKSLVKHYAYWLCERAGKLGYESSIAADVSRDNVLVPKVAAGLDGLGISPLLIKQRTIDTQYSALHKLDWLHIEDTNPYKILLGAKLLVGRDKPVVTLNNISNIAIRESLIALLNDYGYLCFNYSLEEVGLSADQLDDGNNALICVHQENNILTQVKSLTSFDVSLSSNGHIGSKVDLVKAYYNSLMTYNTAAKDLLSSYLFSDNEIIDLEAHLVDGFYDKEYMGDEEWSWSGPYSESKILLPIESPGQYYLRAPVYSLPGDVSSIPLFVFVDGELRASLEISQEQEIAFDFTVEASAHCSALEVLFCIPTTANIDGKSLGFSLSKIELYFKENELQ